MNNVRTDIGELKNWNSTIRLNKFKFREKLTKLLGQVIGSRTHAPDEKK